MGGFDLGFEAAGMRCIGQVEIDRYCRKVLHKHWPDVRRWKDVSKFHEGLLDEIPNVVCGGFPCTDLSVAQMNPLGLKGARSGLWYEFLRIIREIRPGFVVVENVKALLVRGFEEVLGGLAGIGYDAEWQVLPAKAFGAIHQRNRLFIIAYPAENRMERVLTQPIQGVKVFKMFENVRRVEDLRGRSDCPEPLFRGGRDGIPHWAQRLGCCGNAVVPAIAEYIGRAIVEAVRNQNEQTNEVHRPE